ncbi:MAG: YbaN family protein [Neptuniibacter sp.]
MKIIRTIYLLAGILSLTLGIIGAFIPILPTTCFVLFSAFCFSKSSKTMHNYLSNHPVVGTSIKKWEENGEIPFRIKLLSSGVMLSSISYPLFFLEFNFLSKLAIVTTIILALIYIWTRPSESVDYKPQKMLAIKR